jgi:hypothetical protein
MARTVERSSRVLTDRLSEIVDDALCVLCQQPWETMRLNDCGGSKSLFATRRSRPTPRLHVELAGRVKG